LVNLLIEKQCGCFKKSSYNPIQKFHSIDKAIQEAKSMCADMNKNFCLKHKFYYEQNQDNITIKMEINK
jgi:hypothetical protein